MPPSGPITSRETRTITIMFRLTPTKLAQVHAAVGGKTRGRGGQGVTLFRRGVDLAIAEYKSGVRAPGPEVSLGAATEKMSAMNSLRVTSTEHRAMKAATAHGTTQEVAELVRRGVDLALVEAEQVKPAKPAEPATPTGRPTRQRRPG